MRRTVVSAFALLVGAGACSFEHGALQGDISSDGSDSGALNAPWLTGFLYRKPITITPPTLAASLTHFPVGILTASDAQLADSARDDGLDLVFASADGTTRLEHELVTFDGATGALEAWVHLPELPNSTSTIYMYYGAAQQMPSPPSAVWSTLIAGVWHMGQGGSDSTAHAHTASAIAPESTPLLVAGIAGGARSFDGIDDALTVPDPTDGSLDFDMGSFSFSLWVDELSSNSAFDVPFYKGGASTGDPGYCVLLGTANWNLKTHDGTMYRDPTAGTESLGHWVYLVGVVDRAASQMIAYRDGVAITTMPLGTYGSLNSTQALTFGAAATTAYHGLIDEVRVTSGIRSADWVVAEYANLKSPSFLAIGAQQTRP
ncbi:MAG TPA: DUF2341 domain-containing protein [Kofleriaceae bacterium]|jgi:hypothetical protein|nr:DUF2341 domain-containing protein [Kofleriaceae bacterium]